MLGGRWWYREKSVSVKRDESEKTPWDFPGGPEVKTLPSNAELMGSVPGGGTEIPTCRGPPAPNLSQHEGLVKSRHKRLGF